MHTSQIINNSDVGGGEEKQATHHPILQKTRHGDTWVEITYEHGSRPYCKEQLELLQHLVSSQEQNRIELKHLSPSTRKVHHIQPKEEKNKIRVSFQNKTPSISKPHHHLLLPCKEQKKDTHSQEGANCNSYYTLPLEKRDNPKLIASLALLGTTV